MKRKMLNRMMAASIAVIMTVGMTGCGGNSADQPANNDQTGGNAQTTGGDQTAGGETKTDATEKGGSEEQGTTEAADDGMPEVRIDPKTGEPFDLGGMDIIIADWWTNPDTEPTTEFQVAQKEYREWVQETYNFTMVQKNYAGWGWGEGSIGEAFVQAATSGSDENIIYTLTNSTATASDMFQKLMYDITKLDGDVIDLSAKKWQQNNMVNYWAIGDASYCFYTGPNEPRGGLYFNKTVLKDAGIDPETIYDMQADGTWTWDAWVDIMDQVQRDIDSDGQIDVYGCVQNNSGMIYMCVRSNGGSLVSRESDGTYKVTADSDNVKEALHFAVDTVTNKYFLNYGNEEGTNWEDYKNLFMSGKAAFMYDDAYAAYEGGWLTGQNPVEVNGVKLDQSVDYGFVIFPKGPKGDNVTNESNNPLCLPASYSDDKARLLMFAYDVWTEDVPGYEDYYALLDNLYGGMKDTRSVDETIDLMTKNYVSDMHALVPDFNPNNDFLYKMSVGADVDALIDQNIPAWQTAVDALNTTLGNN